MVTSHASRTDRRTATALTVLGLALAVLALLFGDWTVIVERFRFILFGGYPRAAQWRPAAVCASFVALFAATAARPWPAMPLVSAWTIVPALAIALMRGGVFGLAPVPGEFWGGLPLTFIFSTIGFAAAIPPAIALALGRRSELPALRLLSTAYIELVRGVPMITFLFMASLMLPLFLPPALSFDKLLRAQLAFIMILAAYVAEIVRAGLQTIPKGQFEAAASLGLGFSRTMALVVLPQVFRAAIPALVNTFIALFKDTSLVAVIGVFDLLGAAKAVVVEPKWFGSRVEVYAFVAAVYFVFCYAA